MGIRNLILSVFAVCCFAVVANSREVWPLPEVWQMQDTNVSASLRGLCVVDSNVVWASGTGGTVLRSINGGNRWENVSVAQAAKLDFRDVHAFNERRAVVLAAGQPAVIYLTENAGETWTQVFRHSDKDSFFDALSFWDRQHGIAMSDPIDGHVLLVKTDDGGKTWSEMPIANRPKAMEGEAGFAASGTNMRLSGDRCLIALGGGKVNQREMQSRIVYSDDHGKSWKATRVPMARDPSSGIFALAFSNSQFGVAVGGNYLKPKIATSNIALSRDGGMTWQKPSGTPPRGYRSSVAFIRFDDEKRLVAVGPSGTDMSEDSGESWKPVSDRGFHAVAFTPDGGHGWASGSEGRIARWGGR